MRKEGSVSRSRSQSMLGKDVRHLERTPKEMVAQKGPTCDATKEQRFSLSRQQGALLNHRTIEQSRLMAFDASLIQNTCPFPKVTRHKKRNEKVAIKRCG